MKSTHQLIRELNRLDLNIVEYSVIYEMLKDLISPLPMFVHMSKSTDMYYRARVVNEEEVMLVSQIFAPPKAMVKGFQRCNPPKKSMFYTSSKRMTTLYECSAQIGDTVYLSQWMNRTKLPLNSLIDARINDYIYNRLTPEQTLILSYIDTIFTRKIHSSFSDQYKITAAITEFTTQKFPLDEQQNILADGKVGLVYPSIYDAKGSYNTVFHSEYIKERMELEHVMKLEVTDINKNGYEVRVIDNASYFRDGKIHWMNNENSVPKLLEDKNKVPFVYDAKRESYSILIEDRPVTKDKIRLLLNE